MWLILLFYIVKIIIFDELCKSLMKTKQDKRIFETI